MIYLKVLQWFFLKSTGISQIRNPRYWIIKGQQKAQDFLHLKKMNKIKTVSLLFVLIAFSCKSIKNNSYQSKKILKPIKIGLLNNNNDKAHFKKNNVKFENDALNHIEKVFVKNKLVLNITNNKDKYYLFEVFNENYLMVSEYSNIGAGGVEQMERIKLLIIGLDTPNKIYTTTLNKLFFSIGKMTYSVGVNRYYISSFKEGKLTLSNVKKDGLIIEMNENKLGFTLN